jgi:membrane protein
VLFPDLRGVSARLVVKRVATEVVDDAITDTAAQLSFYFLWALFPFLFFLVTLTAYLPIEGAVSSAIERLSYVMPPEALGLVQDHLDSLIGEGRPKLLTLGLAVTLWGASRGVDALRKGLNLAYDVTESRRYWRTQVVALSMTVAGALLIILAFGGFLLGGEVGAWLAERIGIAREFAIVWSWLRWPFTAMVVMLAAALSYYFLPDVEQKFHYITPGSVSATVLWLASTWGFTQYVEHFGRFNATYGSIGAVIVLMVWLYITGLVFLFGGEVNAVIEHVSREGKAEGARREGEAPAAESERPGQVPPGALKSAHSAERMRGRFKRPIRGPT